MPLALEVRINGIGGVVKTIYGLVSSVAVLLILEVLTSPAAAQDSPTLKDLTGEVSITVTEVARLAFRNLEMAPDATAHVFDLPGGGWGVSSNAFQGEIQRFDQDEQPTTSLGRAGEGPGEFGGQVFGLVVDEQLWVVDPRNGRLTAYSESFEIAAERRLPGRVFSAGPAADAEAVVVSGFLQGGSETHGVARLSLEEGADVFGGNLSDHPNPRVQIHMAAETSFGEIWTVAVAGGGVAVLSSSDLTTLGRFQMPDEEFQRLAVEGRAPGEDGTMPRPAAHLSGVLSDDDGFLWVVYGVADEAWSPEVRPGDGPHRLLDTLVLVIDPLERAVVGRDRLDAMCMPVVGPRLSCVDELGEVVRILELALDSGDGG